MFKEFKDKAKKNLVEAEFTKIKEVESYIKRQAKSQTA